MTDVRVKCFYINIIIMFYNLLDEASDGKVSTVTKIFKK